MEVPRGQVRRHRPRRQRRCGVKLRFLDERAAGILPLHESLPRLGVGDRPDLALIAHHRIAGPAIAQQPGEPTVGFVLRRRPPRHHLGLRPGHGDVHQAALVAGGFGPAEPLHLAEVRALAAADMQATDAVVVEHDLIAFAHVAVEGERQVDDRELQTLAGVHRHDLDCVGVAVEAAVALGGTDCLLTPIA